MNGKQMALRADKLHPIELSPVIHAKRSSLGAKFCYALLALYAALIPAAIYLFIVRPK